jgi:hypothetical protein
MSMALKCDLCGKFYEPYGDESKKQANGVITVNWTKPEEGRYRSIDHYDLCQDCMSMIENTIEKCKSNN